MVAGCLVERYRGDIRQDLPEVDAIVGTNDIDRLWRSAKALKSRRPPTAGLYLYHDLTPRVLATPRHFAYIKIAEGCDHPCTFCVIPQYRGKFRSRRFESVVSEATRLFSQGVREINLIGQDTTCYGEDFGLKDGLAELLARLRTIETPQEKWVRFLYAYPNQVTQKLLDTIAEHAALVKYIDMPLQHASASVLKRMKRGANGDIFLKLIERIRAHHSRRGHPDQFHRRLPRRNRRRFRNAVPVRAGRAVRPAGRFLLFRRRLQRQLRARWQSRRAHHRQPQAPPDGDPAEISRARNKRICGPDVARSGGRSFADTDLLWQAPHVRPRRRRSMASC